MRTGVRTRVGVRIAFGVLLVGVFAFAAFFARRTPNETSKSHDPHQVPSGATVEPNQMLPTGEPHAFDVYRANDANIALVFLHGGGGTKELAAYALGLKTTDDDSTYEIANPQFLLDNKVIVVFPQGQHVPLSAAPTWSNYVMTSGEDDMQFLQDLSSYIRSHYDVSTVYLSGHSNGGMMTSRVWCEAPELFNAYVAFAGPPSEHFLAPETPCTPSVAKPYLGFVGSQDSVLQDSDWDAQTWTINPALTGGRGFVDPVLIGARSFLPTLAADRCNAPVGPGDIDASTLGTITTWRYCKGTIQLRRVESADHMIDSLQSVSGQNLLQVAIDFATQYPDTAPTTVNTTPIRDITPGE